MRFSAGIIAGSFIPTYLPTVGTAPSLVLGTKKLIASYAGSCVKDTNGVDIGFSGVTINTPSNSNIGLQTWYDQTTNGNNCTQATSANQPLLKSANKMRGALQGITMDALVGSPKLFSIPAGVAFDRRAMTAFVVTASNRSYNTNMELAIGNSSGSMCLYADIGQTHSLYNGAPTRGSRVPRFNPSVNVMRGGASASRIMTDVTTDNFSAATVGTGTGGSIGGGGGFGASFNYSGECFAVVFYPAALSDADTALVKAALETAFGISYAQNRLLVIDGDSITDGSGRDVDLMNEPRYIYETMALDAHVYNMGVAGTSVQTEYGRRVAKWAAVARSDSAKKVVRLCIGSNDLKNAGGVAGTGTTIWTSYMLPYIQYITGLGYTLAVGTVIPRNDSWTAGYETERLAFNQLIKDNASTYGYTVIDYCSLTQFDTQSDANNTTYYAGDTIHPKSAGYQVRAALAVPVIDTLIA